MVSLVLRTLRRAFRTDRALFVCESLLMIFSRSQNGSELDPFRIRSASVWGIVRMSKARTDMNAEDKGLGQTIAAWFAANGWAQTVPHLWGKAHGVKGLTPHRSHFSSNASLSPVPVSSKGWATSTVQWPKTTS